MEQARVFVEGIQNPDLFSSRSLEFLESWRLASFAPPAAHAFLSCTPFVRKLAGKYLAKGLRPLKSPRARLACPEFEGSFGARGFEKSGVRSQESE